MNYEPLIKSIKRGECLLVLGPELAPTPNGEPLLRAFAAHSPRLHAPETLIYTADGLMSFSGKAEAEFTDNWRDFCDSQPLTDVYKQLAQIPVPLVFSLATDGLIERAYEQAYKQRANFLTIGTKKVDTSKDKTPLPTVESPLVISLFSNVGSKAHSYMVLTHLKMIDFLFNILANGKERVLPEVVREVQISATRVVFLGCKLDAWYMKIFLQLFEFGGESSRKPIAYIDAPMPEDEKRFWEEKFAMQFVEESPHALIQAVWKVFNDADLVDEHPVRAAVNSALAQANLKEALRALTEHFREDAAATNDIVMQRGRLSALNEDLSDGVITAEAAAIQRNQIIRAIQAIAQTIE